MKKLSAIMVLVLLLSMCAACGGTQTQGTADTTKPVSNDETLEQEETIAVIELPTFDYEDHEFVVLCRSDATDSTTWNVFDVCAKEQNGDLINDAVYMRNLAIEEKYNIVISENKIDGGTITTTVNNVVMSGDDLYDAVMNTVESSCTMMLNGSLIDISDASYLDFTQPWWAGKIMEDVSIGGRIFFATGDICLNDDKATWGVIYNKKIANDYSLPNLYDIVNNGEWTLDLVYQYMSACYSDLNGDGKMTLEDDLWGMYEQLECAPALYLASGMKAVDKDNDNNITYNLNSEKSVDVFNKIYDFMADESFQFIAENHTVTNIWATMRAHYRNDQALFFMTIFGVLPQLRDMESDFGLLPLPKILENQDQYYSTFQYNNATAYSIPKSAGNFDRSCIILESMAMGSPNTLTKAYFDMTLQEKALRDKESIEMMQMILENRIFDFSMAFATTGVMSFLKNQVNGAANNFVSAEVSQQKAVNKAIEKILTTVEELE